VIRDRAAELRRAFDRGFAEAPRGVPAVMVDLLRLRIGTETYMIRTTSITAIHAGIAITTVPATAPELIGVAAIRTALVPVYDLRVLLGVAPTAPPRWLVQAHDAGFAFEGFDGHARVAELPADAAVASHAGRLHAVIDLAAILAAAKTHWKER
jgi:hypothetical protein